MLFEEQNTQEEKNLDNKKEVSKKNKSTNN